tara:strand:+ start:70 stop:693 length:624 start_codon:yes stop_codon:yes gene_type:complete
MAEAYRRFGNTTPQPQKGVLYGGMAGSPAYIDKGAFGSGRMTPEETRQDAINWGQNAGLPNRISFAGESGRDILNPNEMRVNAPSVEHWKQKAQRKMMMDMMYQGEDNPYYQGRLMDQGPHPSLRIRGMGGGLGSLQEQAAIDPSDWRSIERILEAGGDPGTETQTAGLWQTWQKIKDRIGEDAANDWLTSQQPAYANRGGLMSLRR